MLTDVEKIDILWKKDIFGKTSTSLSKTEINETI